MAAFANLSFEDEDPGAPGYPDEWSSTATNNGDELASYTDGTLGAPIPFEAFDGGWSGNELYISGFSDPPNLTEIFPVEFNGPDFQSFEHFETKWLGNEGFLFAEGSTAAATYPGAVENFETGWGNTTFQFVMGPTNQAVYDVVFEGMENFEEEWANDSFQYVLGSAQTADYYQTSGYDREDFEQVVDEHIFTVDPTTDTFTSIAHGYTTAVRVTFRNENGRLPEGLQPDTIYVVLAGYTPNTFQVSGVPAGPPINILDNGTGTHFANNNPVNYWIGTDQMTTI